MIVIFISSGFFEGRLCGNIFWGNYFIKEKDDNNIDVYSSSLNKIEKDNERTKEIYQRRIIMIQKILRIIKSKKAIPYN